RATPSSPLLPSDEMSQKIVSKSHSGSTRRAGRPLVSRAVAPIPRAAPEGAVGSPSEQDTIPFSWSWHPCVMPGCAAGDKSIAQHGAGPNRYADSREETPCYNPVDPYLEASMSKPVVFLLGPSGVGKTTLGDALHEKLGMHHILFDGHPEGDGVDVAKLRTEW